MTFNRILITRMKFIGDVVLTTPIIRSVRDAYPGAHISYLGDAKAVSLLEHNPWLDEIIPFDFTKVSMLYSLKMFAKLRAKRFDLVIDLFSNPRSAMLSFATGAGMRIGGDAKGRGRLYTHRIRDDGALKSAIDYHYQSLVPLGITKKHHETKIFITEEEKRSAEQLLRSIGVDPGRRIVMIHPGATWPNKIWLKENFRAVIERLIAETDVHVVLSPGPKDDTLMTFLARSLPERVFVLPLLPVRTLAALLTRAKVFISNDSGPMHIGVAVGTPTIGIFGPEPIEIWFPYDRSLGHLPMFKKIDCSPCRTTACRWNDARYLECMQLITVDEMLSAVMERLK